MNKLIKSKSRSKTKNIIPQFILRANKKKNVDLKVNKIPKTKLKFGNNSIRRFGQDVTNLIKNNPPMVSLNSFHKKSSSVTNRVSYKNIIKLFN